ncbi:hypothetical protein Q4Q39_09665 [Flavivirga amylovorans]|uniref:Uncharacterized protein n=1 Tax=Flavivirga amylovorans TaxID=870486 RepID=A0ABT8X139_9FLAO|nr:hypothetical protein [Flavivirga amylovorans]MDO5987664.1 hypothetical protein [Flavivirga amylovorans]
MPKKPKKIVKIITGVIIFLTLPSLLFFGFLFFKFNEDLPNGVQGEEADALAYKMLEALDYDAFKNTNYIEWTFKKRHHYEWDKAKNICKVYWKEFKVNLDLNDHSQSKAYIHSFKVEKNMSEELIAKALNYFNNDSFWLVAPYKVFDKGAERRLVKLENGDNALLVTYTTGGSTPGDSYLWLFDNTGKPKAFKMWTSILPIEGLEASWSDWTTTESGAQLPTFHKLLVLGLEINHIKGSID